MIRVSIKMKTRTKTILDFLHQVLNEIQVQIPLASNRFEEVECAPAYLPGTTTFINDADIGEQIIFHEKYRKIFLEHEVRLHEARIQYSVYEHINDKYVQLKKLNPIDQLNDAGKLLAFTESILKDTRTIINKIVRANKYLKTSVHANVDNVSHFIQNNMTSFIEKLTHGELLTVDYLNCADRFKKDDLLINHREIFEAQLLNNNAELMTESIVSGNELLEKEISVIRGIYLRRMNVTVGYCGEQVSLALLKILERLFGYELEDLKLIEQVIIKYINDDGTNDGNHTFLAINRNKNSQLNNIASWGEDAILFDPWHGLICLASEFKQLPTYYFCYPSGADWSTWEYDRGDAHTIKRLEWFESYYQMTNMFDIEKRHQYIKEEYQLVTLDEVGPEAKKIINTFIQQCLPEGFNINVNVFITACELAPITVINGFEYPTFAINKDFLADMKSPEQLAELKFAIANTLMTFKMQGVKSIDTLPALEAYKIDKLSLDQCPNWMAAEQYLRRCAVYKSKNKEEVISIPTLPELTKQFDHTLLNGLQASFEQRLKNLQTYLMQDQKKYEEESSEFHPSNLYKEISSIHKTRFYPDYDETQSVMERLAYLKSHLPTLNNNEIIPYEFTLEATARIREFCQLLYDLSIDLNNEKEAHAADVFIDHAFELKVRGFDRIYCALIGKRYSSKQYDTDVKYLEPIGIFKRLQKAISEFAQSENKHKATIAADKFTLLFNQLATHFSVMSSPTSDAAQHLQEFKKLHDGKLPTFHERYFGSNIGKAIQWTGFSDDDSKYIDLFIQWAEEDDTGSIAKALYQLGIYKSDRILNKLPLSFIQKSRSDVMIPVDLHLLKYMSKPNSWSYCLDKDEFVAAYQSRNHVLDASMFDQSVSFADGLNQFYDANFIALRNPKQWCNYNVDNHVIHYLLSTFAEIARSGSIDEKQVIKDFFLDRENKKDLYHLHGHFKYPVPYMTFIFTQQYNDKTFELFSQDEQLKLMHKYYISDMPLNVLFDMLGYSESTDINMLVKMLEKIEKYDTRCFYRIFENQVKKFGSQYNVFSHEIAVLSSHLFKNGGQCYETARSYFQTFRWITPCRENALNELSNEELIICYRAADYFTLFPSHEVQSQVSQFMLDRINAIPNLDEKLKALKQLLFQFNGFTYSLSDFHFRNHLIKRWVDSIYAKYGADLGDKEYLDNLKRVIKEVYEQTPARERHTILSLLANKIQTQRELSEYIGGMLQPIEFYMVGRKDKIYAPALSQMAAVSAKLGEDVATQKQSLDFLTSPLTDQSLHQFSEYLITHQKTKSFLNKFGCSIYEDYYTADDINFITVQKLREFYSTFWDRPLEERAVMIDHLIIPANKTLTEEDESKAYQDGIEYAAAKLFPNASVANSDDEFALAFLGAYLNAADKHFRNILLSGMLVVSNECIQQQEISTGKKLALLCEHMGPAYVKLAQAIHSHPSTPEHLRRDLDHVKGHANPPYRWNVWRLLTDVLPDNVLASIITSWRFIRVGFI